MDPNVFKTVMAVGRRMGASRKQLLAAAETGLVESNFQNLPGGDADSQGWRQERRSLYPNPTNVEASAARFFQEAKQHDRPGLSAGDLAADVQRPAAQYRGRYSQAEARAAALLGMKAASGDASAQAASVGGSTTTNLPGATFKTTVPTVDQAAFEDARRKALVGQLIARRNPNSFLLRSGLLSTVEPSLSEFMGQQTTTSRVSGKTVTTPGASAGGGGRSLGGARGAVHIAPGADRPGVSTQPIVKSFIAQIAGHAQRPLTIGTGTNHNRMTLSGNVSDHWTGHAADLPQPVDSHQGDMVAAHALQVAGVPWSQAIRMAEKGGVFNVTPTSGPYKGHRVQVLWKTMVGGNHHNHVHVGIR